MLSDLTQALKTPFSMLGVVVLSASLVVALVASQRKSERAKKVKKMAILASVFAVCVTAMVVYQAAEQIKNDREYREIHALYSIRASIKGAIRTTAVSDPLTFRASSGQVNVGCNDRQPTNVIWSEPEGATEIQPSASWENIDNVKDLTQTVSVGPNVVTASGSIAGLDRNFFGNCAGGGHGELVLKGTYRVARKESHGEQTLKTISDKVNRLQPFIIAVPREDDVSPTSCVVEIEEGARRQVTLLTLKRNDDGSVALTGQKVETSTGTPIVAQFNTRDDKIMLQITQ